MSDHEEDRELLVTLAVAAGCFLPTLAFSVIIKQVYGEEAAWAALPWSAGMFAGFFVLWVGVIWCVQLWKKNREVD